MNQPQPNQLDLLGDRYLLQNEIGQGGFGQVFKAFDTIREEIVAIKILDNVRYDSTDSKRNLREIYLLNRMNHPNIIKILDLFIIGNLAQIGVVMEYIPRDLRGFIYWKKTLDMNNILKIFYQILQGMNYLKSMKVIHRDLKPANILIDDNYDVKICDFGLARGLHFREEPVKKTKVFPINKNVGYSITPKLKNGKTFDFSGSLENVTNYEQIIFIIGAMEKVKTNASSIPFKETKKMEHFEPLTKKKNDQRENKENQDPLFMEKEINEPKKPHSIRILQKCLSRRVGTRWYRAPEIILLNPYYDNKVDIWSLGCIFAELLCNSYFFFKITQSFFIICPSATRLQMLERSFIPWSFLLPYQSLQSQ